MKINFRLCKAFNTSKEGRKFPTFFSYILNDDFGYMLDKDGNKVRLKVIYVGEAYETMPKMEAYPYNAAIVVEDDTDTEGEAYLGYDRTKEGYPRLDRNGKRIRTLFVKKVPSTMSTAPRKRITIDEFLEEE